jgi:predicted negative regulator of RcsB-dependent stress response
MKRTTTILLVILLLIAIGAFIGYRMYTNKVPNYADQTPDITVTSTELADAFNKDTANASKRFMDKIVRVSGMVKSLDSSAVVLGEEGSLSDIVVGLDDRNVKALEHIKVGDSAILQGKFSGYSKASGDDLLASLGATIKIDYAGLKDKNTLTTIKN